MSLSRVRQIFFLGSFAFLPFDTSALVDLQQGQRIFEHQCMACHSLSHSSLPQVPNLAGQNPRYLKKQLIDYQQDRRFNLIMTPAAKKLSSTDIDNVLAYIKSLKNSNGTVDPALFSLGQKIYRAGDLSRGIPACAACHGPSGQGNNLASFPALAGQNSVYIQQQLTLFQAQKRTNDSRHMMQDIAAMLIPQEQQAVASFVSGIRSNA
jgi:cytochrome c553